MPDQQIEFTLNGESLQWKGAQDQTLLDFLRLERCITSPKDGCSGEGSCGACTVEIDGRPGLACRTPMNSLQGKAVITMEGLPPGFRDLIGRLFAEKGAVQCGFCSPGFIMRTRNLFMGPSRPSRQEIIRAIRPNLCRCTGYVKIVDAIEAALEAGAVAQTGPDASGSGSPVAVAGAGIGQPYPKYQAVETALACFTGPCVSATIPGPG